MSQVLIRRALSNTQGNELRRAELISRGETTSRVTIQGQHGIVEVPNEAVVPMGQVLGPQYNIGSPRLIAKSYPQNPSALVNFLKK